MSVCCLPGGERKGGGGGGGGEGGWEGGLEGRRVGGKERGKSKWFHNNQCGHVIITPGMKHISQSRSIIEMARGPSLPPSRGVNIMLA